MTTTRSARGDVLSRRAHVWTVHDVAAMVEAGVLRREDRVELVDGQVVDKVVVGHRHAAAVMRLTEVLVLAVAGRLSVSVQNPVILDDRSQPEPDLAVLRRRDDGYTTGLPGVADVVLLVEVADSSAAEDRRAKIPRYAAAGVPEVWLLDLAADVLERYREPTTGAYGVVDRWSAGRLAPAAAGWAEVDVALVTGRG